MPFSLRKWLMKHFSGCMLPDDQRIFNYRLSYVHRAVENAFGIMANRFACLLTNMNQSKDTVTSIINYHENSIPRCASWYYGWWGWTSQASAWTVETRCKYAGHGGGKSCYNSPMGATAWQNEMIWHKIFGTFVWLSIGTVLNKLSLHFKLLFWLCIADVIY